MNLDLRHLQDKSVIIMGLGLYEQGSGITSAKFAMKQGAKLLITDLKTEDKLSRPIAELQSLYNELLGHGFKVYPPRFVLGSHEGVDFSHADLIIRNPGVPYHSPFLKVAHDNNVPVETDISIFFKLFPGKIIGITGTRGKSTTTTLIYEILKAGGINVSLGGNIGISPLINLDSASPDSFAVLELSSWLLESLDPYKLSPHIGVFTNLLADHLNVYPDMETYGRAKQAIFKYQKENDSAVFNFDNPYTQKIGWEWAGSKKFWFSCSSGLEGGNGAYLKDNKIILRLNSRDEEIIGADEVLLPGRHNLSNILGAVTVAGILNIDRSIIKNVLSSFGGLPNRLELIGECQGVKYYNDTTSTTPDALCAALESFGDKKIVLIAGGSEKNLDFKEAAGSIASKVKNLILLKDQASFRLEKEILSCLDDSQCLLKIDWAATMEEAVQKAMDKADSGEIILLSPGCASFGLFQNEFDRGAKFVTAVRRILG